ncbi:MAG: outer membrane lipoprotein-sorting protein [Desulfurivibrionaceae bacterium]
MSKSLKQTLLVIAPLTLLCVWAVFSPRTLGAEEEAPGVAEIVDRTNQVAYYQGKDGKAEVFMTIVDSQNRERNRRFTILRRDEGPPEEKADKYGEDEYRGDQKFYIYFHRPSDVEDMVYLVWKHHEFGEDDDRWLYLPDLDLVKRIAASDKRTSFVGSHFFYEDVSGRNPDNDEHELVETTGNYYVLKNTPKRPDMVEFKYYKMWIHKDSFVPVQISYYNDRDQEYRKYTVQNVEKIDGYLTITKAKMEDLQSGGHTMLSYDRVKYDRDLPVDIFDNYQRYLRNPPMQYIK